MKTILKKSKMTIAGLALAIALNFGTAKSQVDASVEGIRSSEPKQSYVRSNLSHRLPLGSRANSFVEFYGKKGYFGKTTFSKPISGPLGMIAQAAYSNGFETRYGAGISVSGKITEKVFAKVFDIPFFFDDRARLQEYKGVVGYYVSVNLPLDISLSSFGEIRTSGKKGAEWSYGEISLEKKITDAVSISYQPALKMKQAGQLMPGYEHRLDVKLKL